MTNKFTKGEGEVEQGEWWREQGEWWREQEVKKREFNNF